MAEKKSTKSKPKLTPPQRLSPAKRKAAIKGVAAAKAKKIAAKEPIAPRVKPGKTKNPLAPERVKAILGALRKTYPHAVCALTHRNAWELTVATILSAQSTDVGVNKVTPELFRLWPTPADLAKAPLPAIEEVIHSTGFFRAKAKSVQGAARVVERFGGEVPRTMEEMLELPGVARKTANVVLGSWYGIPSGVVVDTHVLRLSRRLELTKNTEPVKVEQDLQKVIPRDRWIQFSHEMIHHGRQVCLARKPRCEVCSLERLCNSADKTWSSH
ncbi:MAG TPA: endonuclease III [Acidobacteriaceae bacterium]|jgi:endonuclease-3|nr:endonuclease III [Acidobacteriaceae bacterium]